VWRRRGSKEGEAGRRVQEVQIQTPRSGFRDPRRKVREEPNAGVRSQIPRLDFVVYPGPEEVPEKVQVSRDVDRLVTIKARVKEKKFSFSEASASFQAERFFFLFGLSYRSAGDLACKRPVRPITVFFFCKSSCLFYFFIFCVLVRRATSFSISNLAFFLGKEVRPEGTAPPIVGGVEE
jgi:hypothetical protein